MPTLCWRSKNSVWVPRQVNTRELEELKLLAEEVSIHEPTIIGLLRQSYALCGLRELKFGDGRGLSCWQLFLLLPGHLVGEAIIRLSSCL